VNITFVGYFTRREDGWKTDEERVATALERAGASVVRMAAHDARLEDRLRASASDWVLFSKIESQDPDLVTRLRQQRFGGGFAQILFDLMDFKDRIVRGVPWFRRNRMSWWIPVARQMDIVFLREKGHLERYGREGVKGHYLDQACDADESPASEFPPSMSCDVAFFGACSTHRALVLRHLGRGRTIRIYSDRRRPWIWRGMLAERAAYGSRLAQAVAGANIVYGESVRSDIHGYWSDRVYRILGHRGFFLTRYAPGLEDFFTNHEHLVWGHDDHEIAALASRYLADEPARRRIAAAGFAHVRAHHTYDHRARELLGVLERIRAKA
jgi:spore maturation protein CgeB